MLELEGKVDNETTRRPLLLTGARYEPLACMIVFKIGMHALPLIGKNRRNLKTAAPCDGGEPHEFGVLARLDIEGAAWQLPDGIEVQIPLTV